MNELTAIVPFRADAAGERVAAASAVLRHLHAADIEVILVEHAGEADARLRVPNGVERLLVPDTGAFSKALACNAAASVAPGNVLACVDADTLVPIQALLRCARHALERSEVVRPFGRLIELDANETARLCATGELPAVVPGPADDRRGGEHIPLCGGIVVLPTERYWAAGGMDESFVGWGGEDDAFSSALVRTGSTIRVLRNETAFHLWHERSAKTRYAHPRYQANAARAAWWGSISDDDLSAHVTRARARYGR